MIVPFSSEYSLPPPITTVSLVRLGRLLKNLGLSVMWELAQETDIHASVLRKMGSGRTGGSVVGDVWRVGHSGVGAGAPVRELGRGDI